MDRLPEQTERVAAEIVDAALKVHKALGPGLLESVYETCMVHELERRGLGVGGSILFICHNISKT